MRRRALALTVALAGCSLAVDTTGLTGGVDGGAHPDAAPADAAQGDAPTDAATSDAVAPDAPRDAPRDAPPDAPLSAYRAAVLADGPLAYWRMGITSGVTIPEETGSPNALTLTGAATLNQPGALVGDHDGAIRFDGATAYATALDARPFDFANDHPFTIELWSRLDPCPSGAQYEHMVSNMLDPGLPAQRMGYYVYVAFFNGRATRNAVFEWDDDGGQQNLVFGDAGADGVWQYETHVFDGASLRVYLDGALVDTSAPVTGSMTARTSRFVVGAVDPPGNFFCGALDEIAVYDKPLDAAAIARHHAVGLGQ